jgi:hypothetical protein
LYCYDLANVPITDIGALLIGDAGTAGLCTSNQVYP